MQSKLPVEIIGNLLKILLKFNPIKPRLHGRFFPRDFLKSSTNCGGYTRDKYFDDDKLCLQTARYIRYPGKKKTKKEKAIVLDTLLAG